MSHSPPSLDHIKPPKNADSLPDDLAKLELNDFNKGRIEAEHRRADLNSKIQDIQDRRKYAGLTFGLICCWLVFVGAIVVIQGIVTGFEGKFLSDNVVITLLATTTINILGLFAIVMKYLFYRKK